MTAIWSLEVVSLSPGFSTVLLNGLIDVEMQSPVSFKVNRKTFSN